MHTTTNKIKYLYSYVLIFFSNLPLTDKRWIDMRMNSEMLGHKQNLEKRCLRWSKPNRPIFYDLTGEQELVKRRLRWSKLNRPIIYDLTGEQELVKRCLRWSKLNRPIIYDLTGEQEQLHPEGSQSVTYLLQSGCPGICKTLSLLSLYQDMMLRHNTKI